MSARGADTPRTGIRRTDDHASWQQVYILLEVEIDQHEDSESGR